MYNRNATTRTKHMEAMDALNTKCSGMYSYLSGIDNWCVYPYIDDCIPLYGMQSSNAVESIFAALLDARFEAPISFLNGVLSWHNKQLVSAHEEARKSHTSVLTAAGESHVTDIAMAYHNNRLTTYNIDCNDPLHHVYSVTAITTEKLQNRYEVVKLIDGTCTCRGWQQHNLICVHAYCALVKALGKEWRSDPSLGTLFPKVYGDIWLQKTWSDGLQGNTYSTTYCVYVSDNCNIHTYRTQHIRFLTRYV